MNNNSDMIRILKRISIITGFAILVISIQFSYDGFDQSISGVNANYTTMAVIIGYVLAVVFSVIEFIFGTAYRELNWTLRGIGVFAYIYSIYTNYLGIKHLLGADDFMAWSLAIVMDVYPEPAIAWALGESVTGDMLGNIGKMLFGEKSKQPTQPQKQTKHIQPMQPAFKPAVQKSKYQPEHRPHLGPIPPNAFPTKKQQFPDKPEWM